jgi:predicted GIY-YIG superfamily endonuclease
MSWLTNKFSQLQSMFTFGNMQQNAKNEVDLSTLKMAELKAIAKEKNLKGYTKLRKADLVEVLKNMTA